MRWFPFLSWPRPDAALLRSEAVAGLTVGLMVIPQGVAYAALAHMPLVAGIYASLLPALAAVLFGASSRLSVGPTALTCLMVSAALTGMAETGSADWITLTIWLALLSGAFQMALGVLRFGWLLNIVNAPVLAAFTQAAAVLIIASQLPVLLGFESSWRAFMQQPALNGVALAFGLGSALVLTGLRRWRPGFPTVLLVVLASAGLSRWIGFEALGGAVVGVLPAGLPALALPLWPGWDALLELALPVLAVTMVSFLETASSAKVDNSQRGQVWDQDQDLIGQGLAKIVAGLSGAFPTSSSFSRSALNIYAGAQTGWATVFSVLVVGLSLLLFLPLLRQVPQAVLAAIVVVAVIGLIRPREFVRLWRISRVEAAVAGVTFVTTLLSAPRLYWGVLVGIVLALGHFLFQRMHPRIIEVGSHADGRLRDRQLWQLPALAPGVYALRMDAALDFGSAHALERAVTSHINACPDTRTVALIAHPINWVDATGVESFARLRAQLEQQGRNFFVAGLKLPVERVLADANALYPSGHFRLFATEQAMMDALGAGPPA